MQGTAQVGASATAVREPSRLGSAINRARQSADQAHDLERLLDDMIERLVAEPRPVDGSKEPPDITRAGMQGLEDQITAAIDSHDRIAGKLERLNELIGL